MKFKFITMLAVLSYLLSGNGYAELKQVQLLKNPFIKPGFVNANTATQRTIPEENSTLSEDSLRATLSASYDSIANVDGLMLFVGDKIKGYELISIDEGSATLVRNGKEIILHVSETHKKLK